MRTGLDAAIDALQIELVLTAHPTEVLRRTLVLKYDAIGRALAQQPRDVATLERLIAEAWHSDEVRHERPTPQDEAKWGFAVIEQSLWEALPRFLRQFDASLVASGRAAARRRPPRRSASQRGWAATATAIRTSRPPSRARC